MTTDSLTGYATFDADRILRLERLLPGSLERVWSYLTDPALRAKWLAAGPMEPRAGGSFELIWRNDDLAPGPALRPEGFGAENRMTGTVTEWDPPRRLSFTWTGTGGVSFDLEPVGDRVRLTVTHRAIAERRDLLSTSAGWHTHLDILDAVSEGRVPQPFWPRWQGLKGEYEGRFA